MAHRIADDLHHARSEVEALLAVSKSITRQGSAHIDATHWKHRKIASNAVDEDRFTHASQDVASRFKHMAMSQVLYAGSNVETKSHENENFHEQTLLSLMKRWYKPI